MDEDSKMATIKTSELRRVQFEIPADRLEDFDQLMAYCDMSTRKDLFDNALSLFKWAVGVARSGNEIASYNRASDHVEVVRFNSLDIAAWRAKRDADEALEERAEKAPPERGEAVSSLRTNVRAYRAMG